jgi:hypothetical protein
LVFSIGCYPIRDRLADLPDRCRLRRGGADMRPMKAPRKRQKDIFFKAETG